MSGPDFQHTPLPSAETHMRLLSLLPRTSNEPIPLALKTVPLREAAGTYEAVSYTWGSFLPVFPVLISSQRLWIRENIWRFLRHCSSTTLGEKLSRSLWIDSICINQRDVAEKNAQVQRMAEIFAQARQVIVWLGKASRRSSWAECAYDRMSDFLREAYGRRGSPESGDVAMKKGLRELMTSPYWTRLWIVQELALARGVVFVSGTELCDINALFRLGTLMGHFFQVVDADSEDVEWKAAAKQVDRLVERHLSRETHLPFQGLASLVEEFAAQQCYDPHDHVYGLLGLLGGETTLAIDYESDMEVLFWQVLDVTHRQMSAMSLGARRDSYQWNMETLLGVLRLRLEDIFAHDLLRDRIEHDRFAVEVKNNGRVVKLSSSTGPPVFSLIVSWYYYGDLSILISSDLTSAHLAYVSDPLNVAYAGDIYASSVETRQFPMSGSMRRDLATSIQEQNVTHEGLVTMAEKGESLSVAFSFASLVELSRLSAIREEYLQPKEKKGKGYVNGAREWIWGFPWDEVMERVERARVSIPAMGN